MIENRDHYTYREAALRVRRAIVTVKRWRRHGMPMTFDDRGRRIVDHQTLLKWLRETIQRNDENRMNKRDTPREQPRLTDLP